MRRLRFLRRTLIAATAFLLAVLPLAEDLPAQTAANEAAAGIRSRIEGARHRVICGEEGPCRSSLLPGFYRRRHYRPAWSDGPGATQTAASLLDALRKASSHGLRPADYHLQKIEALLAGAGKPAVPRNRMSTDLDLLLTDAFLSYAADLSSGKVNPAKIEAHWHIPRARFNDLGQVLEQALETGTVEQALQGLAPSDPRYAGLARALAGYREIERRGGWVKIPPGKSLKKGDRGARVPILRNRLTVTGELAAASPAEPDLFDDALEAAVAKFQKSHGLDVDGHAGPQTLAAMNVPVQERVRGIRVNMERWRWLSRNLGEHYIWVNIPGFDLTVYDKGQAVLSMAIIVGKAAWSTPVFERKMNRVVLNPYWHVPPSIAVKETIPRIRRDPGYLDREQIKVISLRTGRFVNPRSINWSRVPKHPLPYRFRQDAGPKNALGRIKFLLPNPYNVYLHDTPERRLFERAQRGFSHGCIRIEKPLDLAVHLLGSSPAWTRENILTVIDAGKMQEIPIPVPVETYILYFTAWTDADGTVEFREDIYRRDEPVAKGLDSR